jgi:predicted DNA-binding protein with PD1-like motif
MQVEVLRLSPGQDLRGELQAAFRGWQAQHGTEAACILSSVGSLSVAVLRFAAEPDGTRLQEPLELLTLGGTLGPDGVHLHASVSDAHGRVHGGHVMPGCTVRTTAEIVVGLLPDWSFRRRHDAATGYLELSASRKG